MRTPFRTSDEISPASALPTWEQLEARRKDQREQWTWRTLIACAFVLIVLGITKAESCEINQRRDCESELSGLRQKEAAK